MRVGHFGSWFRPRMADDELRRVPPDIAVKVGRIGNLGGNAGIVLVPVWDEGFFYLPVSGHTIVIVNLTIVYF